MMLISSTLALIACTFLSLVTAAKAGNKGCGDGRVITVPEPLNPSGAKLFPGMCPYKAHPFIAPRQYDQRGPCPALNTLANHGYLPRNGIATFEQIVLAVQEVFNMESAFAETLTSLATLVRGNAYTGQLSIGGITPLIPPLPDHLDGNVTKGIATHGRMEGDVSLTRQDALIGDNRNFQEDLFDVLLEDIAAHGADDPETGPRSLVSVEALQEFKWHRFVDSQTRNPGLEFRTGRFQLSYGEAAFLLVFFANGTTGKTSVDTLTSFFRKQTFPPNWHRHPSPFSFGDLGPIADEILSAHPIAPGVNAPNGTYVADSGDPTAECSVYNALARDTVPAVLTTTNNTLLKQNVDTLIVALNGAFAPCPIQQPQGPAGV